MVAGRPLVGKHMSEQVIVCRILYSYLCSRVFCASHLEATFQRMIDWRARHI